MHTPVMIDGEKFEAPAERAYRRDGRAVVMRSTGSSDGFAMSDGCPFLHGVGWPLGRHLIAEELGQRPVWAGGACHGANIAGGGMARRRSRCCFYGSCLRQPDQALDRRAARLLCHRRRLHRRAYDSLLLACANARAAAQCLLCRDCRGRARTLAGEIRGDVAATSSPPAVRGRRATCSIWARFCQPARLIWSQVPATDAALPPPCRGLRARCSEMPSRCWILLRQSDPLGSRGGGVSAETYAAELRSESSDRALSIVAADEARYARIGAVLLPEANGARHSSREGALQRWRGRRTLGKALNYLRLIKAAFTFDGAVDYVMWKVRRHSGVVVCRSAIGSGGTRFWRRRTRVEALSARARSGNDVKRARGGTWRRGAGLYFLAMARNNAWANHRLLKACARLSAGGVRR